MRYLHLLLAVFLLASSVTASACHGVGDVHVICINGTVQAFYVEDEETAAAGETNDCCPMAGFDLADNMIGPTKTALRAPQNTRLTYHAPPSRAHTPSQPRGPPARLFF